MINTKTINKIEVEPLHTSSYNVRNLLGKEYFDIHPYNLFISAKKKSGKTSLIYNIIKNTTDKNTKFFLFVSTHNVDKSWGAIKDFLGKRGNVVEVFDSILDGKNNNLNIIMDALAGGVDEGIPDNVEDFGIKLSFDRTPIPVVRKRKKKKKKRDKICCEYLFIFDDISNELRNSAVASFMKKHRHFGASCIISSQYVKDLTPSAVSQIDYFITFKNFSEEKLLYIHKLLDLSVDWDDFFKMYQFAVSDPYSFLYCNVRTEEFRKMFNQRLELKK